MPIPMPTSPARGHSSIESQLNASSRVSRGLQGQGERLCDGLRLRRHSWDLPLYQSPWDVPEAPQLPLLARAIFDDLGLTSYFMIRPATFANFIREVSAGYNQSLPFHNFHHGVSVLQGCYAMLTQCHELTATLTIMDRLALCVAALGHDLGHTGTSNAFLVNSRDELALQYNDVAVLESHHAASLFRLLLLRPDCSILASLDAREFKEARKSIIGAVLATDMAKHFHDIGRLKSRLEARQAGTPFSADEPLDRQLLLEMTLHAADLSGPVRPWGVSRVWAGKVSEEFDRQLAEEARLSLPISTFMQAPKPQLELNFIEFVVLPLWRTVAQAFPTFEDRVETMLANHERWGLLMKNHRAQQFAQAKPNRPQRRSSCASTSSTSSTSCASCSTNKEDTSASAASASASASAEHKGDTDATVAEDSDSKVVLSSAAAPSERSQLAAEATLSVAPAPTAPPSPDALPTNLPSAVRYLPSSHLSFRRKSF